MDRVRDLVAAGGVSVVLAQDRDRFAREPAYLYFCAKSSRSTRRLSGHSTTAGTGVRKVSSPTAYWTRSPDTSAPKLPRGAVGAS